MVLTPNMTYVTREVAEAQGLEIPKAKRRASTRKTTAKKATTRKPASRKAAGARRKGK